MNKCFVSTNFSRTYTTRFTKEERYVGKVFFFLNLHSGGWKQGPLDTAAT
jgi:hypothetical protein